jgi:hypothetical protein
MNRKTGRHPSREEGEIKLEIIGTSNRRRSLSRARIRNGSAMEETF